MLTRKYSVEHIVAKLREAEKLQGQGLTIAQVRKRLQISDQTFFPVEDQVRGPEGGRGPTPEGAGAGERPAEEAGRRAGPGDRPLKDLNRGKW